MGSRSLRSRLRSNQRGHLLDGMHRLQKWTSRSCSMGRDGCLSRSLSVCLLFSSTASDIPVMCKNLPVNLRPRWASRLEIAWVVDVEAPCSCGRARPRSAASTGSTSNDCSILMLCVSSGLVWNMCVWATSGTRGLVLLIMNRSPQRVPVGLEVGRHAPEARDSKRRLGSKAEGGWGAANDGLNRPHETCRWILVVGTEFGGWVSRCDLLDANESKREGE